MGRFQYIRCFWRYIDRETPVVLFCEADLENERCAARMTEVFPDRRAVPVTAPGFGWVSDAPVPPIEEINRMGPEFFAEEISREDFEAAYSCRRYEGPMETPPPLP